MEIISGGTNYYPFNPDNDSIEDISKLLETFSEAEPYYQVSLRLMKEILAHIIPSADFKIQAFCSVLDTIFVRASDRTGNPDSAQGKKHCSGYRCFAVTE